MSEMILKVGELHDPGERAGRPWRVRDPTDVDLVRLARSVRQQLQGRQLNIGEALAAQPPTDGGTALEQVVEQGRGARVRRDGGRDPLDVVDHRIAEAIALTHVVSTGDCVRDLRFHGPSFNVSCISICWRPRSS